MVGMAAAMPQAQTSNDVHGHGDGRNVKGAPEGVEARLRSFTKALVRRHADSIIGVMRRLLRDITLSDEDIRSTIRLSRWRDYGKRARTAPV
jgi:hypothetical protein